MLKVIDFKTDKNTTLVIDEYVPFSFQCGNKIDFVPLYWRTGNFKTSLIEIGINNTTGALSTITVTCFAKYELINQPFVNELQNIVEGVPVFDVTSWAKPEKYSDNFKDEPYEMYSLIGHNFASFWIAEKEDIKITYRAGQLCMGFNNSNELIKLDFINLSKDDLRKIKKL